MMVPATPVNVKLKIHNYGGLKSAKVAEKNGSHAKYVKK